MAPAVVGMIIARMDSARLPAKVLQQVAHIPVLGYVIARARAITGLSNLVLATTDRPVDDELVAYAQAQQVPVYRGDTNDVAQRVLSCARHYGADYFVRLNGDSPFLDPAVIEQSLSHCQDMRVDLITNLVERTYPYGVSVEVVRTKTFETICEGMTRPEDREHVTRYFYHHQQDFEIYTIDTLHPSLAHVRLVVDTPDDMKRFERMVHLLGHEVMTAGVQRVADVYTQIVSHNNQIETGGFS